MEEVVAEVPQQEVVTEIQTRSEDEIVALFCDYKNAPGTTGDDSVEIVKGGEAFFKLKAGQFKKMTRAVAQWHVGKASRWDVGNPLTLSIKTLDEISALQIAAQAKKHAQADADAAALQAAQAAAAKLIADAAAATALRRDFLEPIIFNSCGLGCL